jgi:hypothetical protein
MHLLISNIFALLLISVVSDMSDFFLIILERLGLHLGSCDSQTCFMIHGILHLDDNN